MQVGIGWKPFINLVIYFINTATYNILTIAII